MHRGLGPAIIAVTIALLAGSSAASGTPAAVEPVAAGGHRQASVPFEGPSSEQAPAQHTPPQPLPDPLVAEADFVARINQLRASRGAGTLTPDPELTREARIWATNMANAGRIFHTSNLSSGITANWARLGENVGVGSDLGELFQAFVDSPTHYDNLVDPRYTTVGVGVVIAGNRMFTTHRFMSVAPEPAALAFVAPPETAPPMSAPPTTAPPPSAPTATAPPTTAPPTTAPPTTAPPTTAPPPSAPTATAPPDRPENKLGPIERIRVVVLRDR